MTDPYDPSGFVCLSDAVPSILQDIRYFSAYNFVGKRIDGYDCPVALGTREMADALACVSRDALQKGFFLKIYDAYRPARAVRHFVRWAEDIADTAMQDVFYPGVDKRDLFALNFISKKSGHSRGSTVDLTLVSRASGKETDMGGVFDFFGPVSHADYPNLTDGQKEKRLLLRSLMTANGFRPLSSEWWHFTLENEPCPDTQFDFPVAMLK